MLYQVVPEKNSLMMSYVIKTKTNKIIIIDGGIDGVGLNADVYLLDFLRSISGKTKPEIDAWFFTHIHIDHVNEFIKMVNQKAGDFTVNNIYFNFPSRDFIHKYANASDVECYDKFVAAYNKYKGDSSFETYRGVQVGDVITVDDVVFQIMQIPFEKETANPINNSSIVFKMTTENQTVLFLGDLGIEAGARLLKTYGDDLKCDMVQMSHHGQAGVAKNVYDKISPKVCLWPTPIWVWENKGSDGLEGKGPYQTTIVRKWMYEDLGVPHHFVSGISGIQSIEFPFPLS